MKNYHETVPNESDKNYVAFEMLYKKLDPLYKHKKLEDKLPALF